MTDLLADQEIEGGKSMSNNNFLRVPTLVMKKDEFISACIADTNELSPTCEIHITKRAFIGVEIHVIPALFPKTAQQILDSIYEQLGEDTNG